MADEAMLNGYEVDFSEYDDTPPMIDKGTFEATVYDIKNDPTSDGNPMVTFIFKLQGGPFDGWQRTLYVPLMKKDGTPMLWKLAATLKAFGITIPKGKFTIPRTELLGRRCRLLIDHEPDTYNDPTGKTLRDTIKQVLPAIGGAATSPQVPATPKVAVATSAPAPVAAAPAAAPVAAPAATPVAKAATKAAAKKAAAPAAPAPAVEEPVAEEPAVEVVVEEVTPAAVVPDEVPAEDGADNEFDFS